MKCPVHCARYNQCVDPLYARHYLLCMISRQQLGHYLKPMQHRLQASLHISLVFVITIGRASSSVYLGSWRHEFFKLARNTCSVS